MMRAASVFTYEIDSCDLALEEIKKQLTEKISFLKNTAGILQCDPEFIESGVAAHICRELGFPIVGGSTAAQATDGALGDLMLTLLVLTSDDVEFVPAHTQGLRDDLFEATALSFEPALAASSLPLQMILTFPPIVEKYPGDWYIEAFERLAGPTPVFGSLAVDDAITVYDRCSTICNGEDFKEEMSYLLVFGNLRPHFFAAPLPGRSTLPEQAVITGAEGNYILKINGMRAIDYFESVGLAKGGQLLGGVDFIPLLMKVKNEDDEPLSYVRGLIRFDERGAALCRGIMFEGAELVISSNTRDDVLSSSVETARQINQVEDVKAVLMFSCIVRRMMIGADFQLELTEVKKTIRSDVPFMLAYAGGEIAPIKVGRRGYKNLFYNYTFIACLFV